MPHQLTLKLCCLLDTDVEICCEFGGNETSQEKILVAKRRDSCVFGEVVKLCAVHTDASSVPFK